MSPKGPQTVNGRPPRINLVLFFRFYGPFSLGEQGPADLANRAVASVRGAVFSAIINNPQVERIPMCFRKKAFQVALRLHDIRSIREFPPLGEPVNVGVDRKRWKAPYLAHDHRSGFVAHPG
jgi:hypothetical protein